MLSSRARPSHQEDLRALEDGAQMRTRRLPAAAEAIAPDGSHVRLLAEVPSGGMAHFELAPGQTSIAQVHRSVEELWWFLTGRGQMWRRYPDGEEEVVDVGPGVSLAIPVATRFQFRSYGHEALASVGVTMPPWPGSGEAQRVKGPWEPTVTAGPS